MQNIQDFIGHIPFFRKFEVDDLLFVEFKCPIEDERSKFWCDNNFFAFILVGDSLVRTPRNDYPIKSGEAVFVKKGSILIESEYQEDFCELLVFVPDNFIRSVMHKYQIPKLPISDEATLDTVYPFGSDEILRAYFYSLLAYFNAPSPPSDVLLKLKFEELIVQIMSQARHDMLRKYFTALCYSTKPSIKEIMEENFMHKLTIPEFARLCARSLSSFKSEFKRQFGTTPGRWLQNRRLQHCKFLLDTTGYTIDEICFYGGFENKSHFTRVFKEAYGNTPGQYRLN